MRFAVGNWKQKPSTTSPLFCERDTATESPDCNFSKCKPQYQLLDAEKHKILTESANSQSRAAMTLIDPFLKRRLLDFVESGAIAKFHDIEHFSPLTIFSRTERVFQDLI